MFGFVVALDFDQVMNYSHYNRIIHRDLKPDKVLLTDDQEVVKLVDFGLVTGERSNISEDNDSKYGDLNVDRVQALHLNNFEKES